MNLVKHPIQYLIDNVEPHTDTKLQFSIYRHTPQSLLDQRTFFDLPASELSGIWLNRLLSSLNDGEELALHSCIFEGGKRYHLPMIDLECTVDRLGDAKKVFSQLLPSNIASSLAFYDSGRSLHAYSLVRLKPAKEWREFMGRILLANLPGEKAVVDSRWVGHRLIGGFCSLRWSSNTEQYLKMPERVL